MKKDQNASEQQKKSSFSTRDLALMAVMTVALVVCSYITIPLVVPMTLQTLAVFTTLLLLGGKKGVFSILAYLLLGIAGLPVFTGFQGGFSAILGPTGGYLIGFVIIALIYMIFEIIFKNNHKINLIVLSASIIILNIIGGVWMFLFGYMAEDALDVVLTAILPCIALDVVKLIFADILYKLLMPKLKAY